MVTRHHWGDGEEGTIESVLRWDSEQENVLQDLLYQYDLCILTTLIDKDIAIEGLQHQEL